MNDISTLFKTQKFDEICLTYKPQDVVRQLSFKESMILGCKLILNDDMAENLRTYGVSLIEKIRQTYPKEWVKDWRNEVFLGDAYYLLMRYDEMYEAYKRASENIFPIPPALLISLAGCYLSPNPHLTIDEAEKLVLEALENEKSIEGAILIRGIYKTKKKFEKFSYWNLILQELEKCDAYMKNKWPEFLTSIS